MPPVWAKYVRLRTATFRRRRCQEMFGWTDEQYDQAPARFCDWALAFDRAESEGQAKRMKAEAEAKWRNTRA